MVRVGILCLVLSLSLGRVRHIHYGETELYTLEKIHIRHRKVKALYYCCLVNDKKHRNGRDTFRLVIAGFPRRRSPRRIPDWWRGSPWRRRGSPRRIPVCGSPKWNNRRRGVTSTMNQCK